MNSHEVLDSRTNNALLGLKEAYVYSLTFADRKNTTNHFLVKIKQEKNLLNKPVIKTPKKAHGS